jgi:predicted O-methyltransferase YrrM
VALVEGVAVQAPGEHHVVGEQVVGPEHGSVAIRGTNDSEGFAGQRADARRHRQYRALRARRARHIVEFGASFGISTIYLAAAVRDNGGGRVITTEIEPGKISRARDHWRRAGVDPEIQLLEGDALQTLRVVSQPIDLLFLDGWKDACLPVLQLLEPHLAPGACVLCDDIKGFRKTLKPYVNHVRSRPLNYVSMELPLGDGLEFTVVV